MQRGEPDGHGRDLRNRELALMLVALVVIAVASLSLWVSNGKDGQNATTVYFPITGGTASPPNYVTNYGGGIKFGHGANIASITDMIMNTKTNTGTARINKKARTMVFTLGQPNNGGGGPGEVSYGGYTVSLTSGAATTLDSILGTKVFATHKSLGSGNTKVKFQSAR